MELKEKNHRGDELNLELFKNWYLFHKKKELVLSDYPSIWKVPEIDSFEKIFNRYINTNAKVIEFGAGWKRNLELLKKNGFVGTYESFDIDESNKHDYRSLNEIKKKNYYNTVLITAVLEHLEFYEIEAFLKKAYEVLKAGGNLIVSVPNPENVVRTFTEITHIRNINYKNLGALLYFYGFKDVKLWRYYCGESLKKKIFRKLIGIKLNHYFGIDYATELISVATK